MFSTAEVNYLIKTGVFSLFCNYLRPSNNSRQLIFNINAVVFDSDNLLRLTKMVKCLPEFEYFAVFLKNRNFISKIIRSKVTDYAALIVLKSRIDSERRLEPIVSSITVKLTINQERFHPLRSLCTKL